MYYIIIPVSDETINRLYVSGRTEKIYSRQIFSRNLLYTVTLQLYYIIRTYYYFARTRTWRVNTVIIIIMYSHSIVRIYIPNIVIVCRLIFHVD